MDTRTGTIYPDLAAALAAKVPERDLVEVRGTPQAVARLSRRLADHAKVREARRRKKARRQQRTSRRRNRA